MQSSSQTKPKRPTFYIKSRNQLNTPLPTNTKVRYVYKVRCEMSVDVAWAFSAIHEEGYSYRMRDDPSGNICFQTDVTIDEIRELWDEKNKDLHVMIESLNYSNDYSGERYFTRYSDEKNKDDKYISDSDNE